MGEVSDKKTPASVIIPGLNVSHLDRTSILQMFVKQDICSPHSRIHQATERREKLTHSLIESNGTNIPDRERYKYTKKDDEPYATDDESDDESNGDIIINIDDE